MKITVTTAFNDMTIADDQQRRREIGASFEVSTGRAEQLIGLGFARDASADVEPVAEQVSGQILDLTQADALPGANVQPEAAEPLAGHQ